MRILPVEVSQNVKDVDTGTGTIVGEEPPLNIPRGNPTITLDDIRVAAANLLASGGVQKKDLQELNAMFNIKSLLELKPEQFDDYCQIVFDQTFANGLENEQLSNLRDTLLPQLMSGELDISDIDL